MAGETGAGGLIPDDHAPEPDEGHRLEREYRALFPHAFLTTIPAGSMHGWQPAAVNGATVGWALRTAGTTADGAAASQGLAFLVLRALRLASAAPVGVTDGLLADGWTLNELSDLMAWAGTGSFPETARRLGVLHRTVSGFAGPTGAAIELRWHTGAAVLTAVNAGLTDLQTFRWLQVLMPGWESWDSGYFSWLDPEFTESRLRGWVAAAGPDGWPWAAAGYTSDQARALLALPVGHPGRPGGNQLAVMAALRT